MLVSGEVRYDIASPYCGSERRDTHHHGDESGEEQLAALHNFDVKQAHCYDPNEECRLRRIIDTVGAQKFEMRIRSLEYSSPNTKSSLLITS